MSIIKNKIIICQITAIIMATPMHANKQKSRADKLKTLCTLDTYNLNPLEQFNNKENKSRNIPYQITHTKNSIRSQNNFKRSRTHTKSLHSALGQSRHKQSTPKTRTKRITSNANHIQGARVKTEYNQTQQPYGFKKIVNQLKKKLVFSVEDDYKFQTFKVLKILDQTPKQQYSTVKIGISHPKKYTLIRTKHTQIHHKYEMQSALHYDIIPKLMHPQQKKLFLKVHKIWKQKKEWMITIDNYINASWSNDRFYLLLNHFKNKHYLLKSLLKQVASGILALSNLGRSHNNINLESIYFQIVKGEIRPDGHLKIAALSSSILAKHKKGYLQMPLLYRTPPQILNFILFEEQQAFDRQYLQQISNLRQGWQTDIWSLGILGLQLLNGGPLSNEGSDCSKLIVLQKQLLIRYSYLFQKTDNNLHLCLCRMLSLNPGDRPHPKQIIQML